MMEINVNNPTKYYSVMIRKHKNDQRLKQDFNEIQFTLKPCLCHKQSTFRAFFKYFVKGDVHVSLFDGQKPN